MAGHEQQEVGQDMVPVINLEEMELLGEFGRLVEACKEWGCFVLVNHRFPSELMAEMKGVATSLLNLPQEIKSRNTDPLPGGGYVGPSNHSPLYEALDFSAMNSPQTLESFCNHLEATPYQRETIKSYTDEMHKLAMDISSKIAMGMGLPCDLFRGWPCQLRMNKYSFTKETIGSIGVGMHTDSGFLTILQPDECVRGFQVMDPTGTFLPVDPSPGSLVINLGDVAKAWSNGTFCTLKHRVLCKEAGMRISIATLLVGPDEEAVEAPPELVDSSHLRAYRPFTYLDYRKLRCSTGVYTGEALAHYANKQAPDVA